MKIEDLTKIERSCLTYLETCAVDAGGLVESVRMNSDDFDAIEKFKAEGLLRFGRVHSSLLEEARRLATTRGSIYNYWVEFCDAGWKLAADARKLRARQRGPFARKVFAIANENQEA